MGVYWATTAAKNYPGAVEIIDLRTLSPIDTDAIYSAAKRHSKVMLVTEESIEASFTLGLAGRIQRECFEYLDRSEEHTSELQSRPHLVCRLLLEKKNNYK